MIIEHYKRIMSNRGFYSFYRNIKGISPRSIIKLHINDEIYNFFWEHANELRAFEMIIQVLISKFDGVSLTLNEKEKKLFKHIVLDTGTVAEKIRLPDLEPFSDYKILYADLRQIAYSYDPEIAIQFGFKNKIWELTMDHTQETSFEKYYQYFPRDLEVINDILNSNNLPPLYKGYFTAISEIIKRDIIIKELQLTPGGPEYKKALEHFNQNLL